MIVHHAEGTVDLLVIPLAIVLQLKIDIELTMEALVNFQFLLLI